MKQKIVLVITFFNILSLSNAQTLDLPFRIVGYYSLDVAADVKKALLKKLTHVNLWFLNPDSLGNFTRDLRGFYIDGRIKIQSHVK